MKIKSLIVALFCLIQIGALTGCQTAPMTDGGDRAPANTAPTFATAMESLARSSTLNRFQITQIVENSFYGAVKVSAIRATQGEAAALKAVISLLEKQNSPLAGQLKLNKMNVPTLVANLKVMQTEMANAAAAGTDAGKVTAGGFGIPTGASNEIYDAEVKRLTERLNSQLKASVEATARNATEGAKRVPANAKFLKNIVKTAAKLAQAYGQPVTGPLECVKRGDLSDPEALENFANILEDMLGSGQRDMIQAWKQSATRRLGKDPRCNLVGQPCDGLSTQMGAGC